ncbi:hypothetical protein ACFC5Z_16435 [Streptomyces sp. NPDC056004]|uniref:hypothetical protein n=1 Tax=unclassified Streptomyces TaxID=2593676 RepID=UPI0035DB1BDA
MVPYHLIGAANLDSALLDGYVRTVRAEHPDAPTPPVYKSDALLADARSMRESLGDEAFARLLPTTGAAAPAAPSTPVADDGLAPIGSAPTTPWTGAELDAAFAAPADDEGRKRLVSALLSSPMKPHATARPTMCVRSWRWTTGSARSASTPGRSATTVWCSSSTS